MKGCFRQLYADRGHNASLFFARTYAVKVDLKLVSKLKKETELSLSKCKDALEKSNNNYDCALQWVKENAASMGLAKAAKLKGRVAAEGSIGIKVERKFGVAGMVEVNCETDFVSKNQSFKEIVDMAAVNAVEAAADCVTGQDKCGASQLSVDMLDRGAVRDLMITAVGKMGEKLVFRRAVQLRADVNEECFGEYRHGNRVGSICVVSKKNDESLKLAKQLAAHIAGMKPSSMGELMDQEFMYQPGILISALMANNSCNVQSFAWMEVGDGIEKKETESFDAEVHRMANKTV